jgi:hypothetical protein
MTFGGTAQQRLSGLVWFFDSTAVDWIASQITGDAPGPRSGHVAAPVGPQVYIMCVRVDVTNLRPLRGYRGPDSRARRA